MIDNISGSIPGVKASTVPKSASRIRETSAHPAAQEATGMAPDKLTRQAVAAAVKEMNDFIKSTSSSIEFSLDEDTGRTVVKMIDTDTNEVIRQFPTEEALAISKALDRLQGLTVHVKA